ncbi:enhanced downy mildew 2-like protein [Tanacetum coccineum]
MLHKQVKAWKYESLNEKLEISVLSKTNVWIKLLKPRKIYEHMIRTILITLHCLHFFKRKPKASSSTLWKNLCEVFSLYDVRPSEDDLIHHLYFIGEAVKRDETLQKSKFLASFLEGKRRKKKAFDQNDETIFKSSFIVDDVKDKNYTNDLTTKEAIDNESKSKDEDDMCDTVCAICDDGGFLTNCDGKCFRAFHATVESAESAKSKCISLGLPSEKVKGSEPFFCLNCTHEVHQCFACGELGSSNKSSGAEVFCCSSETCGHFYHPKCVAKLIQDESDTRTQLLEEKIADGESFICPVHKCHKCKQEENEKVKGLQFAICRRCPKSYHRKCLPRTIVFAKEDDDEDDDEFIVARAWNNLLPKSRALIFCLKHEIALELKTPVRNIKFPEIGHAKKKVSVNEEVSFLDYTSNEIRVEMTSPSCRPVDYSRKRFITLCGPGPIKKQRLTDAYEKHLKFFVPVRHNITVMEKWKNSNTVVAQQHGHISKAQEPLLFENVEAFDLPVENPEIVNKKVTSQTTKRAENRKSSKHIAIAQQHDHISSVQGPILSDEHVEAFDFPVQYHEILSKKDTIQTTEKVINCKSSKNIDVAQHQGLVGENHEFVGEKDTSRKTELENQESSKWKTVLAFHLPMENRESVSQKDTTSQTIEEIKTRVSKEMPVIDSHVYLFDSPVENCKSNGEKHTGQTTKKGKNRNSRKRRRRSKAIAIAQKKAHISKIQKPKILGKSVHPFNLQVNNCDLNAEKNVSQTTRKAAATCLIRSQKESTRCDKSNSQNNIATRDLYVSATDEQPYNKSIRPNDGVDFHGYERENDYHDERGYYREAYNGNCDRRHYHDRISTPAIQRYTLKLDEGNHKWMENRRMWFYNHHPRGCDPRMYADGFARGPFPHRPQHNSSCDWIDERMSYWRYVRLV